MSGETRVSSSELKEIYSITSAFSIVEMFSSQTGTTDISATMSIAAFALARAAVVLAKVTPMLHKLHTAEVLASRPL